MEKFYVVNGKVQAVALDELRRRLNLLDGCPMPSGVAPKYTYTEGVEFSCGWVTQCGAWYESERYANNQSAEFWLVDANQEDHPEIKEVTVFVVGYNRLGKFYRCDSFATEAEAVAWVDAACDELVANDPNSVYFDSREEAQKALDEFNAEEGLTE